MVIMTSKSRDEYLAVIFLAAIMKKKFQNWNWILPVAWKRAADAVSRARAIHADMRTCSGHAPRIARIRRLLIYVQVYFLILFNMIRLLPKSEDFRDAKAITSSFRGRKYDFYLLQFTISSRSEQNKLCYKFDSAFFILRTFISHLTLS